MFFHLKTKIPPWYCTLGLHLSHAGVLQSSVILKEKKTALKKLI